MVSENGQLGSLSVEVDFARKLAGNDKLNRDRAMRNLARWLRNETQNGKKFTQKELLYIWKGLYYCMWMCDKPLVQEELADKIVGLSSCFEENDASYLNYFDTFFRTMAREYFRIDRFRLDKFLMLTRRMFRQWFVWLAKKDWSPPAIRQWFSRLQKFVLSGKSDMCTEGLQAFVAEMFLQEMEKFITENPESAPANLTPVFQTFCEILRTADSTYLRTQLFRYLCADHSKYPGILQRIDRESVAKYALELGQDKECSSKNRRTLYSAYNVFHATLNEKKRTQSESIEDESADEVEEVSPKPKKKSKKQTR